jgi:hypothetical protein
LPDLTPTLVRVMSRTASVAGLLMWGALSDEGTALPFRIPAGRRQRSHSWVRSHILTVSDSRLPRHGGAGPPVFISPRCKMAQLYPQTLCSLYVASYDSQGDGGGIRSRLHCGGPGVSLPVSTCQHRVRLKSDSRSGRGIPLVRATCPAYRHA